MCNDLNEVGVQGDVEEQVDVEVDAGRQVNALLAPADCFPPVAAQRGRAAEASVKAYSLDPNAVASGALLNMQCTRKQHRPKDVRWRACVYGTYDGGEDRDGPFLHVLSTPPVGGAVRRPPIP